MSQTSLLVASSFPLVWQDLPRPVQMALGRDQSSVCPAAHAIPVPVDVERISLTTSGCLHPVGLSVLVVFSIDVLHSLLKSIRLSTGIKAARSSSICRFNPAGVNSDSS